MADCFMPGLDGAPLVWSFMNSKRCAATASSPGFFVARFLCDDKEVLCFDNGRFGFFEAVDVSTARDDQLDETFDAFRRRVVFDNRAVFGGNPSDKDAVSRDGQYRMFGGAHELLVFNVVAHQADPDRSGIVSVNDQPVPNISGWPFASGDVMNSAGDGIVKFTNPKLRNTITWDFSDAQHPKRIAP
jgi:hypothetical protein